MFIIAVGHGFALGTVFSTFELAQEAADKLNLRNYEIVEQQPSEGMTTDKALDTLREMIRSTEANADQLSYKLAKEREEYKKDPAPDTLAIIRRTEKQHAAARNRELVLKFCAEKLRS
jgi:rubrerythrin